jgi:WD40 repeat protein
MTLSPGTRLGPYEIQSAIGEGGMGEVYKARDTRLDRDVAIKVLPGDIAGDADRLRRFEQEARAVAALNHPNILTVHDVGAQGGTSFVVTELLEGETLREVLSRRLPTQRQVLSVAVQAAHGLAAAHRKGIVHRDLKPENVFVTTDGRVKILDFGLAKRAGTRDGVDATTANVTEPGVLMGTIAYMSPEQARGEAVGLASDVFSFGVVLYELLARQHPFRRDTVAATLSAILHETAPLPSSLEGTLPPALDGVIRRCLEKDLTERFATGHDLAVALEAVLQAPSGALSLQEVEERSPYPGLKSFSEKDARMFFGRDAEVTALWDRIRARRLLAVIGPSGAGKTSFLRAGVVPARPDGWGALVCTPGPAPLRGLGQALGPALAGDADALSQLAGFEDPDTAFTLVSRWRQAHADALLVVDQFEEVFTLNPPEVQARFAELLARLASEADVHIVLSLRDDFLMRCHDHACLAAVFDGLTPLGALTHEGLCRALVEPAARLSYRFEEAALVKEMVGCVEGARAALPLLAFAVSRLWEQRDRERKVLTRASYEDIGGVAGALAQHAEATLDRIGSARQAVVREIFRNLATAQGTRAVVDRDELLSAFSDRTAAEAVLGELVDARLLTSYEVEGREGEPNRHRIEIVHESLLKAWPRLVRWQTQDEDGAHLRDQLKQAARLWADKGRSADLLWTGTAYREYALWRERYTAPLTAVENAFAVAMAARAKRTKRVRTAAVGALVVGLTAVAIAIAASRQTAVESARRAEASKLVALGRLELDRYPTAAVAYARKSLEMMDTDEARRLILEALWRGPVARVMPTATPQGVCTHISASSDGAWLACSDWGNVIQLFSADGMTRRVLPNNRNAAAIRVTTFSDDGRRLATFANGDPTTSVWSVEGDVAAAVQPGGYPLRLAGDELMLLRSPTQSRPVLEIVSRNLSGTSERTLGRLSGTAQGDVEAGRQQGRLIHSRGQPVSVDADPILKSLVHSRGRSLYLRPFDDSSGRQRGDVLLGEHGGSVRGVTFQAAGDRIVSFDETRQVRIWSSGTRDLLRTAQGLDPGRWFPWPVLDRKGARMAWDSMREQSTVVWDLVGPPDADPLLLRGRNTETEPGNAVFIADGRWLACGAGGFVSLWPVAMPWPRVLRVQEGTLYALAFSPDSSQVVTCATTGGVRAWPMTSVGPPAHTIAPEARLNCYGVAVDPAGEQVLVAATTYGAVLAPLGGGPGRALTRVPSTESILAAALDAEGRWAAVASNYSSDLKDRLLHLVDLRTGTSRAFPLPGAKADLPFSGLQGLRFAQDGRLYSAGYGGLHRWDPETGENQALHRAPCLRVDIGAKGTLLVAACKPEEPGGTRAWPEYPFLSFELFAFDLKTGARRCISTHGVAISAVALSPASDTIATGDATGVVRVGRADGSQPHLLIGPAGRVQSVAFSPDGQWVASTSGSDVLLWPMPDLSKPPLHTLPHDVLIAKLESLTNLRAVRDVASSTGWKVEIGPFPGWRNIPTW